jgi:hypothetical protein
LEKILMRLHDEIKAGTDWKSRIEARLYKKGERIKFIEGAADSGKTLSGILCGIGAGGELLIAVDGGTETRAFITGELNFES